MAEVMKAQPLHVGGSGSWDPDSAGEVAAADRPTPFGREHQPVQAGLGVDAKERFGLEPARFLDELTVRMPTAEEIRSLRLPPGTPVASLLRTYRDPTGKPFEVVHFVLAGDKQILVYEGQPSTSA